MSIDSVSVVGDTALVRIQAQHAGVRFSGVLSMVADGGDWRIVHITQRAHPA